MRRSMNFQTVRELKVEDLKLVFGGEEIPQIRLHPPVDGDDEGSGVDAMYRRGEPVA
jgi:hypothetical protein